MQGFLQNSGQVCVCQTRLIVQASLKPKLMRRLVQELEAITCARDLVFVCA